jgi:hypothetical protein
VDAERLGERDRIDAGLVRTMDGEWESAVEHGEHRRQSTDLVQEVLRGWIGHPMDPPSDAVTRPSAELWPLLSRGPAVAGPACRPSAGETPAICSHQAA